MNVRLAAQTLSSSVANAIEFLNASLKLEQFQIQMVQSSLLE